MNNNKHNSKRNKKSTRTKRISCEYAIVNNDGQVQATTNYKYAKQALKENKRVYRIDTYLLQNTNIIIQ